MFHRLELHTESSNAKPELIFMDQIEEVPAEFTQFKNEQCIQIKFRENLRTGNSIILTNPVCTKTKQNVLDLSKLDNILLYEASRIYTRLNIQYKWDIILSVLKLLSSYIARRYIFSVTQKLRFPVTV